MGRWGRLSIYSNRFSTISSIGRSTISQQISTKLIAVDDHFSRLQSSCYYSNNVSTFSHCTSSMTTKYAHLALGLFSLTTGDVASFQSSMTFIYFSSIHKIILSIIHKIYFTFQYSAPKITRLFYNPILHHALPLSKTKWRSCHGNY